MAFHARDRFHVDVLDTADDKTREWEKLLSCVPAAQRWQRGYIRVRDKGSWVFVESILERGLVSFVSTLVPPLVYSMTPSA